MERAVDQEADRQRRGDRQGWRREGSEGGETGRGF